MALVSSFVPSFLPFRPLPLQQLELSTNSRDEAIEKHRAWIDQVNAEREALVKAKEDAARKKEEKARRLAEQAKAFRDLVRANENGILGDSIPTELLADPKAVTAIAATAKQVLASVSSSADANRVAQTLKSAITSGFGGKEDDDEGETNENDENSRGGAERKKRSRSRSKSASAAGRKRDKSASAAAATADKAEKELKTALLAAAARKKPAWARSEDAQHAMEDEDADTLLQFAQGLDYDR